MKTRLWLAVAVLAATVPTIATAQGPAAPTAPRTATGAGAAGAPADGKVAVINTSVFAEKIFELKVKTDTVNKKYESQGRALDQMKQQIDTLANQIKTQGGGIATPDALQKLQDQYNQMTTTYKRQGEDLQAAYNKDLDDAIKPVRAKLEDFVRDYAAKRSIILILDLPGSYQAGIIGYFNQAIDITDDFIAEYNKANPVPGAAAAPARPGAGR
jgi:hypothetical protein